MKTESILGGAAGHACMIWRREDFRKVAVKVIPAVVSIPAQTSSHRAGSLGLVHAALLLLLLRVLLKRAGVHGAGGRRVVLFQQRRRRQVLRSLRGGQRSGATLDWKRGTTQSAVGPGEMAVHIRAFTRHSLKEASAALSGLDRDSWRRSHIHTCMAHAQGQYGRLDFQPRCIPKPPDRTPAPALVPILSPTSTRACSTRLT